MANLPVRLRALSPVLLDRRVVLGACPGMPPAGDPVSLRDCNSSGRSWVALPCLLEGPAWSLAAFLCLVEGPDCGVPCVPPALESRSVRGRRLEVTGEPWGEGEGDC